MSQQQKAAYFRALKAAGVQFEKHYREYTEGELKTSYDAMVEAGQIVPGPPEPKQATAPVAQAQPSINNQADRAKALRDLEAAREALLREDQNEALADMVKNVERAGAMPTAGPNPDELPGVRQNTQGDQPIRTDEQGRVWYQEEVLKPGYPKPRGRRVLRTMESAAVQQTVQDGRFIETFEVAGSGPKQATEVKITLPSYQTGIYKDPRYPFKVHCYNGAEGFDFFEVCEYYNGADLVPPTIKRVYVENVLCFDIRTTVQTIQAEFRHLQLTGRIKA